MRREEIEDDSLESFFACQLVPLDKRPGLRAIDMSEVIRQISAKVLMSVIKQDVIKSSSKVQMCSGEKAGCEVANYSIRQMFDT